MRLASLLAFLLFLPALAAALQLNEIMYDLPGSDSGREWVEVYQDGADCINLTQWKFFEANTNHGITLVQGNGQLCEGSYAVIADNPANFLADHVGYSDALFDSSFSLSNTGETIALKNSDGNITDSVAYSGGWGAGGNGRSLERNASGWFESLVNATPGYVNSVFSVQQNQQEQPQNQTEQNQSSAQNAEQSDVQSVQQPDAISGINPPANYSPLIDFSIVGRSNRVQPGSVIDTLLSVRSNYLVVRGVTFCSYVANASEESCQKVELAPDETVELHLYNTLKANVSGGLTLVAELRDGLSIKQKAVGIDVLPQSNGEAGVGDAGINASVGMPKGPTAAFAARPDALSSFITWLKNLLHLT